ncbi:MAG: hypothetical protein D6717_00885 [Gammaproteobacteria bacterium]|nr:MAG: hypothetical protein D6717_00885 [Gammaproteobacteria bacterium]
MIVPRLSAPALVVAFLISLPCVACAEEADYLRTLQSEAQEVEVDPNTELSEQPVAPQSFTGSWGSDTQSLEQNLPAGLDQEGFEQQLQSRFYGSYIFYKNLPDRARVEVYNNYRAGATIDELRKLIIELKRRY